MARPEDFEAFETSFLDSMLEVQMTEEEGEVKISQSDDHVPLNDRDFPPIPMFDLQSETLTYKNPNPYGNSLLPVKQTSILRSNGPIPGSSFPLPSVQPSPMVFIHPNMLKANNVTIQPSIARNAVPSLSGKPTQKSMAKSDADDLATQLVNKFILEVFKPDYVKKVNTNKEDLRDVSVIGSEEEAYYRSAFKDVSKVQLCRLHCTICDKHIGCGKGVEKKISIHSMLKVLTCKVCSEFYGDGNFPCDDGDHCEIYCRWCGQGGALICCSYCPKVFCKRCVRRNYTQAYVRAVEKSSDWACFVCAQKPLWPHRAVCRALIEYMKLKKADNKLPVKDTSVCCNPVLINETIVSKVNGNKVLLSGGQTVQTRPRNSGTASQSSGKARVPDDIDNDADPRKRMIVKNFSAALKMNKQTKSPVAVMKKPNMIPIAPKTSTTSSLSRATTSKAMNLVPATRATRSVPTQRATRSVPTTRAISGVNLPRVINAPIYHGQTLITPPRNNSAQRMMPMRRNRERPATPVTVSVIDSEDVDLSNVPVARIPPLFQGVVLKLNYSGNKTQLVKLIRDIDPNEEPFPIPQFGDGDNMDFLEATMEDSFKLARMFYQRLMYVKGVLDSQNKDNKRSIYKSSVQRLGVIFEKAGELMKELSEHMQNKYEIWEKEREKEKEVKVIDLSDDEESSSGKQNSSTSPENRSTSPDSGSDSDIEVVNAVKNAEKENPAPQRVLRSSRKRESDGKPVGNHTPGYDGKGKRVANENPRKKMKLSEDAEVVVMENGPVYESDTEPESDSHAKNG